MAVLGVDDFKSKLRGGGARPNLFKATINFVTLNFVAVRTGVDFEEVVGTV